MPRSKFSAEEKLAIIKGRDQFEGKYSHYYKSCGISSKTYRSWILRYQAGGLLALENSHTWTRYSLELKIEAVQPY